MNDRRQEALQAHLALEKGHKSPFRFIFLVRDPV
jgi:hypothetical protein